MSCKTSETENLRKTRDDSSADGQYSLNHICKLFATKCQELGYQCQNKISRTGKFHKILGISFQKNPK